MCQCCDAPRSSSDCENSLTQAKKPAPSGTLSPKLQVRHELSSLEITIGPAALRAKAQAGRVEKQNSLGSVLVALGGLARCGRNVRAAAQRLRARGRPAGPTKALPRLKSLPAYPVCAFASSSLHASYDRSLLSLCLFGAYPKKGSEQEGDDMEQQIREQSSGSTNSQ